MVDQTHRDLTEEDISRIAGTYRQWRIGSEEYKDEPGLRPEELR